MLWFIYLLVAVAAGIFATRKWGRLIYNRWGRFPFMRRIIGKSRPATPPLFEEDPLINQHSVYDVFDDGVVIEEIAVKRDVNSVNYNKRNIC